MNELINIDYINRIPKLELVSKKYLEDNYNLEKLSINDYKNKYVKDSLNTAIESLSDSEKVNLYCYLADKFYKILFLEKALPLSNNNIEIAYNLFDAYYESDKLAEDENGVKIAELCIQLSDKKDIKNEFHKIYEYLGKYYYNIDVKKSLIYLNNAIDCCDKNTYFYQETKKLKDRLLDTFDSLRYLENEKQIESLKSEDNNPDSANKENSESKNNKAPLHSESVYAEAHKHYLIAEEFAKKGNIHGAIFQYSMVKEMLPEYADHLDKLIKELQGSIDKIVAGRNADELYNKGLDFFNKSEYEEAYKKLNCAHSCNNNNLDYIFGKILIKELYVLTYREEYSDDEDTITDEAIELSIKNNSFSYLPFLLTVFGDSMAYEFSDNLKEALANYELAIYFLNLIPIHERFAAPYYKLGRLKEYFNNYKEALLLYEQVKIIDASYRIEDDINRVTSHLQDGGAANKRQENYYLELMNKSFSSRLFDDVIINGKKALSYNPFNVETYYIICQAAEYNNQYDLKWAAKEGLYYLLSSDDDFFFDYFYFILGKCCLYEKKIEQAKYYWKQLIECESTDKEIVERCKEELAILYKN